MHSFVGGCELAVAPERVLASGLASASAFAHEPGLAPVLALEPELAVRDSPSLGECEEDEAERRGWEGRGMDGRQMLVVVEDALGLRHELCLSGSMARAAIRNGSKEETLGTEEVEQLGDGARAGVGD